MTLNDIDIKTMEGRLLMAAMVKLSMESQTDKHPDQILEQCRELADKMYPNEERQLPEPAIVY